MRHRAALSVTLTGLLFMPGVSQAHLVNTGLGPIYDGISHLFVSIEDLLPVVAIALLAGLNGADAGRRMVIALPLSWLAGGMAGVLLPYASLVVPPAAVSLLVLGVLTAVDLKIAPLGIMALSLVLGLVHGWRNGVAILDAEVSAVGLVGITGAVFVVATLVSALAASANLTWTRVVMRVVGSWIGATGLLLVGWTLSGRL